MIDISRRLLYYKRRDIQSAIVEACRDREVGIRYGESGFGKRPDIFMYENDVLESVKKGATSFHMSEERWQNPMQLSPEMKRNELDELRIGWDLVLDIDCPYWQYSKLTTFLFLRALEAHGINAVSCKFSGNKGFHIGVPFEAFAIHEAINGADIKNLFPDGPKKIALYLLDYISKNFITVSQSGDLDFGGIHKVTIEELSKSTGKTKEELSQIRCADCRKKIEKKAPGKKIEFLCPRCGVRIDAKNDEKVMVCSRCSSLMDRFTHDAVLCSCGSRKQPIEIFDPLAIVDVDTILISSRHMIRAPYSMHEKTGLVSIPIPVSEVMDFKKESAEPEKVKIGNLKFLGREERPSQEAVRLIMSAFDFDKKYTPILPEKETQPRTGYKDIEGAIPQDLFPPCILKILSGIEDGRKRSLFILVNFLTSVGWEYEQIEAELLEWNKKNKEQLKESVITGQIRYHRQRKEKVLPPNCRSYYQDFRVCVPDGLCDKIKNPVQYSKRKAFSLNKPKKSTRQKLTEEQREMRRRFRENLKKAGAKLENKDEDKAQR